MVECQIDFERILEQFHDLRPNGIKYNPNYQITSTNKDMYICSNCHFANLYVEDGTIICPQCYYEYGNLIDDSAEWKNYNDDQRMSDPTRCGSSVNPLLVESSYGTSIGYTKNLYFNHLKKINGWQSMPYHERSLKNVFDRLSQSGYNNGLTSNIIEYSHNLFAQVTQHQNTNGEPKLSRGDNRDGLIAACLFYACKEYEVPRSPQEIGKICNVCSSDVTRGINLFYDLMKNSKFINCNKHITKYSDFVERYCHNLDIDNKITSEIMSLCQKAEEYNILTKNTPQAMACGCIFFIIIKHNINITKTTISEKCGVSVPTITKSFERLKPYTYKLI